MSRAGVCILGIYAADLQFTAQRQPKIGETVLGTKFAIGPGGKGSNQAVAAARAGAKVSFISRVGKDQFGDQALSMWQAEGIATHVMQDAKHATGAAYIFVEKGSGNNAVLVVPGAAGQVGPADVDGAFDAISSSLVFMTQLETPSETSAYALRKAKAAGCITIFNPAPAAEFDTSILAVCDYCTPNESEATALTGVEVKDVASARKAAEALVKRGVGTALITLGSQGALLHGQDVSLHIPVFKAGRVVDTTGAGDAFNGGFAAALARGATPEEAARFGAATAGLSVTRHGTAPSMPKLEEIEALLKS
jgi:ribokinase